MGYITILILSARVLSSHSLAMSQVFFADLHGQSGHCWGGYPTISPLWFYTPFKIKKIPIRPP